MLCDIGTLNKVKHLGLHVFKKDTDTDGGEVAVSNLLVSQHPLEEPLQVSLWGLQALPTSGQVGYVWCSFSKTNREKKFTISPLPNMKRKAKQKALIGILSLGSWPTLSRPGHLPVVLCDGSKQLSAGAWIKAADTACSLLDLGHLVLILQVDGLCELYLQEADNLIVWKREDNKETV